MGLFKRSKKRWGEWDDGRNGRNGRSMRIPGDLESKEAVG
jgi:hypothetical protein